MLHISKIAGIKVMQPIRLLGKMLARASFLPTLAYNMLMERVTARNWWDRIDSQVVLGAIPFKGEAHKLASVQMLILYLMVFHGLILQDKHSI